MKNYIFTIATSKFYEYLWFMKMLKLAITIFHLNGNTYFPRDFTITTFFLSHKFQQFINQESTTNIFCYLVLHQNFEISQSHL